MLCGDAQGAAFTLAWYPWRRMAEPTLDARVRELEAELARCEREHALIEAIDEVLENALRQRLSLERIMPRLLDILTAHLGARAIAVRTFDESLAERTFTVGEPPLSADLSSRVAREPSFSLADGSFVLSKSIDVAGEDFGTVICFFALEPSDLAEASALLLRFCEALDNHLGAIAQSRHKYEMIRSISDALKDPVLEEGIDRAVELLQRQVGFRDLVLLFRHEDDLESGHLRYKIVLDGQLRYDTASKLDRELDGFVRAQASDFLSGNDTAFRERFGITRYREEVLITGVRAARVIGRMLVTSRQGEFHTYDRELLDRFADYLRQRIVDFNREWKQLALVFSSDVCERLLREESYVQRWLTPREADAAVLYGDISGFTALSERVLKTPEAVGRLIHTWADEAVRMIWETGGVFDKMVGDCVIGIWGPPFFERSPADLCRAACEAAVRIRDHTSSLVTHPALPELHGIDVPFGVAIGVNYCPLSVGLFGPNENYTGFSSGMNNTARLQTVAKGGEILCMESLVQALGEPTRFSERRESAVKNVREPLVYRALR